MKWVLDFLDRECTLKGALLMVFILEAIYALIVFSIGV